MEGFWLLFGLCASLRLIAVVGDSIKEWATHPRYLSYLEIQPLYDECGADDCDNAGGRIGVCYHPIGDFVTSFGPVRWVMQIRWERFRELRLRGYDGKSRTSK